jgi:hypothetical protein
MKVRAVRAVAYSTSPEKIRAVLGGTRWLLVANDAVSSDGLACALRDASAQVRLIDPSGLSLARLGAFDAQVVLSERGQDLRFLRERIAGHPVLRWAAQLSLAWAELWSVNSDKPELGRLVHAALPWLEPDRALQRVVRGGVARFEVPLDRLGPVRALRVLCGERDVFRAQFRSPHERGYVEVAGELVVSASFEMEGFPQITGVQAFARVLELPCLRATVERRVRLSTPSLSLPFEKALELAVSDIRERDGSDSPTLRMASPLSLLENDGEAVTPTPTRTPTAPPVRPDATDETTTSYRRAERARQDSGVLPRSGEYPDVGEPMPSSAIASHAAHILTEQHNLGSLRPGAFTQRIPSISHLHWIGLGLIAALVTVAVMATADRLWPSDAAQPVAQPIVERTTHVTARERPHQEVKHAPTAQRPEEKPAATPARPAALVERPEEDDEKPTPAEAEAHDAADYEKLTRKALSEGNAGAAVKWAEKLVFAKPQRARFRLLYGDALAARGDIQAALTQYRLAQETAPRSRQVRNRLEKYGARD